MVFVSTTYRMNLFFASTIVVFEFVSTTYRILPKQSYRNYPDRDVKRNDSKIKNRTIKNQILT